MLRRAAWLSAALHIAVVLFAYFGLPQLFEREVVVEPAIHVDVYTIAEETAAPPPAPVEAEVPPEPPPPPPEPVAQPEPPAPPEPIVQPEPPPPEPVAEPEPLPEPEIAEAEPPPPEPLPEPEPEPLPEPEPEVVVPPPEPEPEPVPEPEEEQVAAAPVPAAKPKPPEKKEPEEADFSSVENTVALLDKSAEEPPPPEPVEPAEETFDLGSIEGALTSNVSDQITLSEIDAIRQQIYKHWNILAGAPNGEDLSVEIRIQLAPDGRVLRADIVDRARMGQAGQDFYRAAAESALRAVKLASPLKGLPTEKYEAWKDITMVFDPKDMLGLGE